MRYLQISLLLIVTAFATGCPNYRPQVDFKNPSSFLGKLNDHLGEQQVKAACFSQNLDYTAPTTGTNKRGSCSTTPNSKPGGKLLAEGIRNQMLQDTLPHIDGMYMDFITDLQEGRDRENYVADIIELGAAAAVGIIKGPERSIQIVGIALTAFKGGRRSRDLNFYKDQATPILINKMDGNRATVLAAILEREAKDIDHYPVGVAISDIVAYYNAGTLIRAFTELQKDTAAQTRISETALEKAKQALGVVGPPTDAQIEESKQNFELARKIIKTWTDARDKKKIADDTITAERAKPTPDQAVITAQQTISDEQKAIQQGVLGDFQVLFDLILADPKLRPLVDQIPVIASPGDPERQKTLQTSLAKIKNKDPNNSPDIFDYNRIILELNGQVSEAAEKDSQIRGRLKTILLTSKTLKNQTP